MAQAATSEDGARLSSALTRLPLVVRTAGDLKLLLSSPRAVKRLPRDGVQFDIAGLDRATQDEIRARLNRYIRACGCAAGAAAFFIATALLVAYAIYFGRPSTWTGLATGVALGLVVVGAITISAKLIALEIARLRFKSCCARAIESLEGRISSRG